MKNKILLIVLILFFFSLLSFAEVTEINLCKFNAKNGNMIVVSPEESTQFINMIENPQTDDHWTDCQYVVGIWNYWNHYENQKEKRTLPKYALRQRIPMEKAQQIIDRTVEIADFMYRNSYNKKEKRVELYFHYLSEINNSFCLDKSTRGT